MVNKKIYRQKRDKPIGKKISENRCGKGIEPLSCYATPQNMVRDPLWMNIMRPPCQTVNGDSSHKHPMISRARCFQICKVQFTRDYTG